MIYLVHLRRQPLQVRQVGMVTPARCQPSLSDPSSKFLAVCTMPISSVWACNLQTVPPHTRLHTLDLPLLLHPLPRCGHCSSRCRLQLAIQSSYSTAIPVNIHTALATRAFRGQTSIHAELARPENRPNCLTLPGFGLQRSLTWRNQYFTHVHVASECFMVSKNLFY